MGKLVLLERPVLFLVLFLESAVGGVWSTGDVKAGEAVGTGRTSDITSLRGAHGWQAAYIDFIVASVVFDQGGSCCQACIVSIRQPARGSIGSLGTERDSHLSM